MKRIVFAIILPVILLGLAGHGRAARIKDIAEIQGVRQNQLVGYGLVVGLDGTGDDKSSVFTLQAMSNLLERMGTRVNPREIKVDNAAAVMVTAELPQFARAGSRIDLLVSSMGNAKSLQGGTLLLTPLKAADGEVYVVAQGPISTGGFSAGGKAGKVQKNFPTVGRVVAGGIVEKEIPSLFREKSSITLALHQPDFTTASRVVEAINTTFDKNLAAAPDPGTIEVAVPLAYTDRIVEMVTRIEGLAVTPDSESKVVINERTGTVVMGENVRISTIAIAHGNLSITIRESAEVSQPLPFSKGETAAVPETDISVKEEKNPIFLVESSVTIGEVVRALNALGVSPRDLMAIFQAIKAAGALQATLEIM